METKQIAMISWSCFFFFLHLMIIERLGYEDDRREWKGDPIKVTTRGTQVVEWNNNSSNESKLQHKAFFVPIKSLCWLSFSIVQPAFHTTCHFNSITHAELITKRLTKM